MTQCPNCEQKDRITIGKRIFCANCGSLWSGDDKQTSATVQKGETKLDGLTNPSPSMQTNVDQNTPPKNLTAPINNTQPATPASPIIPNNILNKNETSAPTQTFASGTTPAQAPQITPSAPAQAPTQIPAPMPTQTSIPTPPPTSQVKPPSTFANTPVAPAETPLQQPNISIKSQEQRIEKAKNIDQSPVVKKFSEKQQTFTTPKVEIAPSEPNLVQESQPSSYAKESANIKIPNIKPSETKDQTTSAPIHSQPIEPIDLSQFIDEELKKEQNVVEKEKSLADDELKKSLQIDQKTSQSGTNKQQTPVVSNIKEPGEPASSKVVETKTPTKNDLSVANLLVSKDEKKEFVPTTKPGQTEDSQTETLTGELTDQTQIKKDEKKADLLEELKSIKKPENGLIDQKQDLVAEEVSKKEPDLKLAEPQTINQESKSTVEKDEKSDLAKLKEEFKKDLPEAKEKSTANIPKIIKHPTKTKPFSDIKLKENIGSEIGDLDAKTNGVLSDEQIDDFKKASSSQDDDGKLSERHNKITPSEKFEPVKPKQISKTDETKTQTESSKKPHEPLTTYQTGINENDMKLTEEHHYGPGDQIAPDKTFSPEKEDNKKSSLNLKAKGLALTTVGMIVLGAYIWQINYPNLAIRMASAKSGISVNLPSYVPTGWKLSDQITSEPGKISYQLINNAVNDSKISITQSRTDWDSQALAENYLSSRTKSYTAMQSQGLTIYFYNGNKASWINRGNWYKIDAGKSLGQDQILKIATSL